MPPPSAEIFFPGRAVRPTCFDLKRGRIFEVGNLSTHAVQRDAADKSTRTTGLEREHDEKGSTAQEILAKSNQRRAITKSALLQLQKRMPWKVYASPLWN